MSAYGAGQVLGLVIVGLIIVGVVREVTKKKGATTASAQAFAR